MPDTKGQMGSAPGDRQARFTALFDVVYEPLQRYARRRCSPAMVDDVVADTLLVLWRRLDDVPPEAVLPWCYRVAAGCLSNARRSTNRRTRLVERLAIVSPPPVMVDPDPCPDPELHNALLTLAPADQEVLRLWAWESLNPAEIAVTLDVSANTVSVRLHRAKGRLADAMRKIDAAAGHVHHEDPEEVT